MFDYLFLAIKQSQEKFLAKFQLHIFIQRTRKYKILA